MSYKYGSSSSSKYLAEPPTGITEFEILKARHRFLRENTGDESNAAAKPEGSSSASNDWDEQLALKYYESLYREFAICDLKHFKSGNFSLRWRTEEEVIAGTGETTCANSRCEFHHGSSRYRPIKTPSLTTLELPFAYMEHEEQKSALVKVVLCAGCVRKLMWKRRKEKESMQVGLAAADEGGAVEDAEQERDVGAEDTPREGRSSAGRYADRNRKEKERGKSSTTRESSRGEMRKREADRSEGDRRRRHSRSRSPRRTSQTKSTVDRVK